MSEKIVFWQCFECSKFFLPHAGQFIRIKPQEFAESDAFVCNHCLKERNDASKEAEDLNKEGEKSNE